MITHTHPCGYCVRPVECDGTLAQNYDGWPEVICDAYHLPQGGIRYVLCDECLRREDLRHDAEMERT